MDFTGSPEMRDLPMLVSEQMQQNLNRPTY
jgi:hypothetical protein